MKLSILLPTIGNWSLMDRFLKSIYMARENVAEVVIVDQSKSNNPIKESLAASYPELPIIWLKSEKGLSLGRNIAMSFATGDLICFADDDCWYDQSTIVDIIKVFIDRPDLDGLVVKSEDGHGDLSFGKHVGNGQKVTMLNHWSICISYNIFLRKDCSSGLLFDENLGVGSKLIYRSGEESDYIICLLKKNVHIEYSNRIRVFHPNTKHAEDKISSKFIVRLFYYGCGFGAVHRKHKMKVLLTYKILRSMGMIFHGILFFKYHRVVQGVAVLLGRLTGYFLYHYETAE